VRAVLVNSHIGGTWDKFSSCNKESSMKAAVKSGFHFVALVAALSFASTASQTATGAEDRPADRKEITALLSKWERAWDAHDMHSMASLFHEDAVWVLWTGEVWTGRKAFEDGMVAVHKTVYANSVQRERLEELTFVGPDAAVVRFESTLTGDTRNPGKVVHSRKILVVTRRNGVWAVGWGQNTRFADPPTSK
jgi:uncharacterized protein (TIGR02246 family)